MADSSRFERHYDVLVAGGGSAGVAAAVGAAQAGAKVLLVERHGFLGGAATLSQVLAWCGFYPQRAGKIPDPAVAGIGRRALDHLGAMGLDVEPYFSASGNWPIRLNPEATKLALDRTVADSSAAVALHTAIVGTTCDADRLASVRLQDPDGVHSVEASAFVDATGDAVLAFLADATPCDLHPIPTRVQPASYPVRLSGVVSDAYQDKSLRAEVFRQIARRLGRAEIRADGGLITTLPGTGDLWWLGIEVETDGLNGLDLAEAERDGRDLAWRGVEAMRRIPGFEFANVSATGPKIGIRETRHAATAGPLREAVVSEGTLPLDSVALGAWPMEIHHAPGHAEYRPVGGSGVYGIPLTALRSADYSNLLLAGRACGADPAAYGSVRVMGTAFATGHAAGVAAALRSDHQAIRRELVRQHALL